MDDLESRLEDELARFGRPPLAEPPRTPILFSYHKDDDVHVVDGRAPAAGDEILVDADVLSRYSKQVGDSIFLQIRNRERAYHIVGTFDLPGVDLTDIPM